MGTVDLLQLPALILYLTPIRNADCTSVIGERILSFEDPFAREYPCIYYFFPRFTPMNMRERGTKSRPGQLYYTAIFLIPGSRAIFQNI